MAEVPAKLGRYHLLERIAQGGMAEIYKAKSVGIAGFEKIVAVKRIRPRYAREPRFVRNFIDEARIAVSLNHRNVVSVFDFGKAEGELYLAMELIDGADLRTAARLAKEAGSPLPLGLTCHVLAEVAAGLDYAHGKRDAGGRALGIVHCDVSPQNVMLSREGFVKILDFGVARARFTAAPKTRRLRGKPRYMAPEQTRGDEPTAAADVFALGILAWELCTGRALFGGRDLHETLEAVRRAQVPPIAALRPDAPAALSSAVARALSVRPEARGSAAELAGVFARTARELAPLTAASRVLAAWLESVCPRPLEEPAPATPAPLLVAPAAEASDPASEPAAAGERPPELSDPTAEHVIGADRAGALLERRRVVVTAAIVEPGAADGRRGLARLLADLAYKRGAVIQDQDDDAVVAVFGLEVAGEDDVASALRYALDAVELAPERALRIATRAGVVAQRRPGGYRLRADAVAETRALARGAEPGRPILSGGAGRLASAQFSFREQPPRQLGSRRLRVLELTGVRPYDQRARALRAHSGGFVGRARELEALSEAYQRAVRENRRVLAAAVGPAGIGKSRLAAELVARIGGGDTRPLTTAAEAKHGDADAPYALVIDLLQASFNLPPERGEGARARLIGRLTALLGDRGVAADEIAESAAAFELAMELAGGALEGAPSSAADLRDRVASSVRRVRALAPTDRPLLTVIENVDLADQASIDVLRAVMQGGGSDRAELVLITARRRLDDLAPPDAIETRLELGELSADDRRALIRDRLGDAADEARVTAIARRAGGNPLFIEELAAAGDDHARPASVRDVLLSRVDRLPSTTKAVLQHAAVIGPSFRARILEELIGAPVADALQSLIDDGLLTGRDAAGADEGESELSFRHGLLQEVVYESLASGPRRAIHALLGRLLALRAEAGRDEPPAVVARHLELGGEHDEAADFWVRAGKVALAAHEPAAAQRAFSRALELHAGGDALRREALLGREQACRDLGDHEAQARDLAALERMAAADPALQADVQNRIAHRLLRLGDYRAAVRAAEQAEAAARTAGDELCRGEALRLVAEAHERTGAFDRGLDAAGQAIAIFRSIGAARDELRARIGIGRNHLVRSRYAEARAVYEPILAALEDAADPWLERIVMNHLAVTRLCMGEFEDAMRAARRSVELCEYYGDRARAGDNISVCGIVLTEVGQFEEARQRFAEALAIHDETGSRWSRSDCLVYAGANEIFLGEHERALALLGEAAASARDLGAPYIEANASAALAAAYLARSGDGDLERALDAAAASVDVADSAGLPGAHILALARLAEALRRRGATRALEVARRAAELLEAQEFIEGSEEEVLFTYATCLAEADDPGAEAVFARARAGYQRKLERLETPAWRESFAAIPLHAALGTLPAGQDGET